MKASSPARPARRGGPAARGKPAADGPPRLPGAMDACYSRLRALVPSIPRGRRVSRVEILQHVIDYILDLQAALDAPPAPGPAARPPLSALNADVGARPLQVDVPPPLCTAADPQELAFRPLGEDSAVDGGLFSNTDASLGG